MGVTLFSGDFNFKENAVTPVTFDSYIEVIQMAMVSCSSDQFYIAKHKF